MKQQMDRKLLSDELTLKRKEEILQNQIKFFNDNIKTFRKMLQDFEGTIKKINSESSGQLLLLNSRLELLEYKWGSKVMEDHYWNSGTDRFLK